MIILKPRNEASRKIAIRTAVRVLKEGGVIAFPTETVYGIGADPRNTKAVNAIFRIKGRSETKPVQLIAGKISQVKAIAEVSTFAKKIVSRYWPGPLTLLLPLKKGVLLAPRVSPKRTIGIRVTSDAFMSDLARAFGFPIAATSANKSGSLPATSGFGVVKAFGDGKRPDLLIDFGAIPKRKPTTVARIKEDGAVEVLRQGGLRLPHAF